MSPSPPVRTVTFQTFFSAAHRVLRGGFPPNDAANLHGHNFDVEVTLANKANADGLSTSALERAIADVIGWIDRHLHHATILCHDDAGGRRALEHLFVGGNPSRVFLTILPPTAGNLAALILEAAAELLEGEPLVVARVRVQVNRNVHAEIVNC